MIDGLTDPVDGVTALAEAPHFGILVDVGDDDLGQRRPQNARHALGHRLSLRPHQGPHFSNGDSHQAQTHHISNTSHQHFEQSFEQKSCREVTAKHCGCLRPPLFTHLADAVFIIVIIVSLAARCPHRHIMVAGKLIGRFAFALISPNVCLNNTNSESEAKRG